MAGEVELVGDDDGVAVFGEPAAVERFLRRAGLLDRAQAFDLARLRGFLQKSASLLEAGSGIVERSGMYLKLTPESAQRLKDAGGLMKTKAKGVSHAMLGETGKSSLKWLQVQDGPASLLTNPAVLSGVGGLLSQMAQQAEAQEMRELLVRIDEKLDAVRRHQRDQILARLNAAVAEIDEAMLLRDGGDPATIWSKVSGLSEGIKRVEESAILALDALADKINGKRKAGQLKKAMREVEREIAIHLVTLARCIELRDTLWVLELDYVMATNPEKLDGHRRQLQKARDRRRAGIFERTALIMTGMDAAGAIVNEQIVLHRPAANTVVTLVNSTAESIESFRRPLGIESSRAPVTVKPWGEAVRDPAQLKTAGKELRDKALVGVGALGAIGLTVATMARSGSKSS
ncbi:hypothetical protein [Microbacterium lacticum]